MLLLYDDDDDDDDDDDYASSSSCVVAYTLCAVASLLASYRSLHSISPIRERHVRAIDRAKAHYIAERMKMMMKEYRQHHHHYQHQHRSYCRPMRGDSNVYGGRLVQDRSSSSTGGGGGGMSMIQTTPNSCHSVDSDSGGIPASGANAPPPDNNNSSSSNSRHRRSGPLDDLEKNQQWKSRCYPHQHYYESVAQCDTMR